MIEPIAFTLFGFPVHWYGLSYVFGFLFSYFFILHFSKEFGVKEQQIEDIFFYMMVFSVIGGRFFYILFYNPLFYISNPLQVFAVWNGGMSIHGGFLGAIIALYYSSKKYKIPFLKLTDLFVLPTGFALAFGRFANFINQELVGIATNSNLGIVFPLYDDVKRYPYQLLASFKNLVIFQILLYFYFFKKMKTGTLTALFLILYNGLRFIIDFLRVPTTDLGLISLGQLLNLFFMFFGFYLLKKIKE